MEKKYLKGDNNMSEEFSVIVKHASETASIEEVEKHLNIRFKKMNKLSSNVKPNDLKIDMSYQRQVSPDRVNSIVRSFNKNAIGVITLSIRENGDLYIIDGQHRVEALKSLGLGEDDVNAIVFFDLSVEQEAELFYIMNDGRTKPKKFDLHKASSASGNSVAQDIDDVLAAYNLKVGDRPGDGIVRAVGTLHKVYSKIGKQKLSDVIKILLDANGRSSSAFQAEYITAVAALLIQYKELDHNKLVSALQRLGDPTTTIFKAVNSAQSSKPFAKTVSLVCIMIDAYNYRLTKYRLDKTIILSSDARNFLDEQ